MSRITLFHAPGACSRVTMNALEEAGAEFEDVPVNILVGEQKSAAFLAVNPKGKVPALRVGETVLTENAAILAMLDQKFPGANLLPHVGDLVQDAQGLSDLVWCSSTLHPLARSVRMPSRFTDGDTSAVKAKGLEQFAIQAGMIEARLDRRPWFYGESWSIVDVYIDWNCSTAAIGGFDLKPYPNIRKHDERVRARPSFQRALAREQAALTRAEIVLPAGMSL